MFHSLRHSSITYKLKLNGGDIKSVQGDSGHAEARMVTDQYAHILDENRRKLAQLMEENFYRKMNSNAAETSDPETESKKASDSTVTPEQIAEILANPELRDLLIKLAKSIEKGSAILLYIVASCTMFCHPRVSLLMNLPLTVLLQLFQYRH